MTRDDYEERIAELKDRYEERINELQDRIYELTEKPKLRSPHPRWMPEFKGKYYTVFNNGCPYESYWTGCSNDMCEYAIGNVFKKEEAAEFAAERLKVLAEMREWAGKWNDSYTLCYMWDSEESAIAVVYASAQVIYSEMRFATKEDAENCIKAVGEERIKKYYFMVPNGIVVFDDADGE